MNTNNTNDQVQEIDSTQLSTVNGGGPIGWVVKGAKKFGPAIVDGAKKYGPQIADKAWDAAKWTGIPSAVGAGAAWVKHKLDKQ